MTSNHSLKQFGAWVTALTDRYRFNPFVQTTVNIIVILFILAVLLIAISGWAIQYTQNNTVGSIRYHIQQAQSVGSTTPIKTLPQAIETVRARTLLYVFLGLIGLIIMFGYLLIRFSLSPTKESLLLQKRFIGNVAHEIRTPLAIIKTTTEVSLMDPALSVPMRESLEDTIVELDRISETINNLLSFDTLMQPGRAKKEPLDLGKIVETVVARHQTLAASRGIILSMSMGNKRKILGNPTALEQIMTNLLKNAINYTPQDKGEKIQINIESDYRHRVVLVIIDTGIGIAQKDLYHVFEPFYRGDTSRARGIGTGTSGLGLAIVNELVRVHQGSLSIKSAVGQGTTVAISFPPAPESENPETLSSEPEDNEGMHEVSVDFS